MEEKVFNAFLLDILDKCKNNKQEQAKELIVRFAECLKFLNEKYETNIETQLTVLNKIYEAISKHPDKIEELKKLITTVIFM